jgi:hypothetical protein
MNLTYVVLISFKNRRRIGDNLFPRFAVIRVTISPFWPVTRNLVQDGGFQRNVTSRTLVDMQAY